MNRLTHWWNQRRWPRCACGEMRVAPHSRTELAGTSHGHIICYPCDTRGAPLP